MPAVANAASKIFKTSSKHPTSQLLRTAFPVPKRRRDTNDRIDVVSSSLCDDSIEYLSPRLEQYKGCDILDINPGACLWSQSLHKFLKPRRHLLLEPEPNYYDSFIKPLIEQPDSKYRYSALFPTHPTRYWGTYDKVFNDELLPRRTALGPDDPKLRQTDTTLLVTGNLHRLYKFSRTQSGLSFPSCLTLSHFIHASQRNNLFHQYGLVKMLLWIPTEARRAVMPWLPMYRTAYNATNEVLADMAEVCGVPRSIEEGKEYSWAFDERQRLYLLDDIMMLSAADKMEQAGLKMPAGRQSDKFSQALKNRPTVEQSARDLHLPILDNIPTTLTDFEAMLIALKDDAREMADTTMKMSEMKNEPVKEKFRVLFDRGVFDPFELLMPNRVATYIDLSIRLIKAEVALKRLSGNLSKDEMKHYEGQLSNVQMDIRKSILHKDTTQYVLWEARAFSIFDEIVACTTDPPVLAVDRRPYEPMVAQEHEFWPRIPMMLLEIDPREKSFATESTPAAKTLDVIRDLLAIIMWRRGKLVAEALDGIGLDASADLIAEAPDITDPTKGGRLDHRQLKAQNLTRAMMEQLIVAFNEWPFRPTDADMRDMSVMVGQSDAIEEEATLEKPIGFDDNE